MDHYQFRAILLKLQDRLSDNDRKRLHFFLGNDVPRRIRDDPSLSSTLSLMESLFDQDKISEQDFTFLIKAFHEIRCLDAVKLLQEHMKTSRSNGPPESLALIMPRTLDQLLQDQEDDKYNVQAPFINQQNTCGSNNTTIDGNNTTINPVTVIVSDQTTPSSPLPRKNRLFASMAIQKCLVFLVLMLIIVLGILIGFCINKVYRIARLEKYVQTKDKKYLEEQIKNNQTIQKNNQLNDRIKDLEKEKILLSANAMANSSSRFINYQLKIGQNYSSVITGAIGGPIHGTNIYTDDSNPATAAVHAGVLRIGETRNITIKILPGQASYTESKQNDVWSSSFGAWGRSYFFVGTASTSNVTPSNFAVYGYSIGETLSVVITGTIGKSIYGTNIYTDDSNPATAAVHAGVLRIGETKNVMITILPGQPAYAASTRNGVSSFAYGVWGRSYSFIGTEPTSNVTLSSLAGYGDSVGEIFSFEITGAIGRAIYGTNIYTDGDNFATTAIHAGVLHIGETKNVTIKILPGQSSYVGSTQKGSSLIRMVHGQEVTHL